MSQEIKKLENRISYANYQIEKYKKEVTHCQEAIEKLKVLTSNLPSNIVFTKGYYIDKDKNFTKVTNSHLVASNYHIIYSLYYYELINNKKHKVYVEKQGILTNVKYHYDYASSKHTNKYMVFDPNTITRLNDLNESFKKEFFDKILKGTTKYYQGIVNKIAGTSKGNSLHDVDPSSYNYQEFSRLKSMLVFK